MAYSNVLDLEQIGAGPKCGADFIANQLENSPKKKQ